MFLATWEFYISMCVCSFLFLHFSHDCMVLAPRSQDMTWCAPLLRVCSIFAPLFSRCISILVHCVFRMDSSVGFPHTPHVNLFPHTNKKDCVDDFFYNCKMCRIHDLKNSSHCSSHDLPPVTHSANTCDTKAIMANLPFSSSLFKESSFQPLSRIPKYPRP